MRKSLLFIYIAVLMSLNLGLTQIANPGFEQWTAGDPDSWAVNNAPGLYVPITQSTDARSGSFALRGEVVSFISTVVSPFLVSGDFLEGFPVSNRPASFQGFYKFSPVQNDVIAVTLLLYQGGIPVGGTSQLITAPASSYTPFSMDIEYFSSEMPDTCYIQFFVLDTLAEFPNVGSYFLLDDLSFSGTVGIEKDPIAARIDRLDLQQNYPNPFNPVTTISYSVPKESEVSLIVYNSMGQEVDRPVDRQRIPAGSYSTSWNGHQLPSGLYYYRLIGDGTTLTRKMMLIK